MGDGTEKRGRRLLAAGALGMLSLLLVGEFYQEDETLRLGDVIFEVFQLALLVGGTATSVLLILRMNAQAEASRLLRRDVEVVRAEGRRWRDEMAVHLRALGTAIRRQFEAWRLTAAEQEVGLLLLKGLSHKEIARVRGTSEATIRQQAAALYQKADLGGRAALSAFFLEDLLAEPPSNGDATPNDHAAPNGGVRGGFAVP